jgi:methionyl-tRNA synthetase
MFETMSGWMVFVYILLIVWTIIWKGIALWKSARNQSLAWFIVLLIVNTLGILEIIYIFAFSKKSKQKPRTKKKRL